VLARSEERLKRDGPEMNSGGSPKAAAAVSISRSYTALMQ
jgi:hypothetical protein